MFGDFGRLIPTLLIIGGIAGAVVAVVVIVIVIVLTSHLHVGWH